MRSIKLFAAFAALALLPAAAHAQTTLTACYVPKSGTVYRIKVEGAPGKCAQNHVEFSWETGAGAQALYGEITTIEQPFVINPGTIGGGFAACPAGYLGISGGFVTSTAPNLNVQVLSSIRGIVTPGWGVLAQNLGADPVDFEVHATCIAYNP